MFVLYQWDLTETPLGSLFEGEVDAYTQTIADRVAAHAPELDARITAAADDWTADRLGTVERNILRVAIEELARGRGAEGGGRSTRRSRWRSATHPTTLGDS